MLGTIRPVRAVTSSGGRVSLVELDEPRGEGELLRVREAGICGSDLHLVASGLQGVVLGHEFAGCLADGRRIAVRPTGECGACPSCINGHPNTCRQAVTGLHGTSIDGGFADYVRVETSRHVELNPAMSDTAAALVEPMAVAVHGVERVPMVPGMSALVVGAGSIGLLTAAALCDRGVDVAIVARHRHQAIAAEQVGAKVLARVDGEFDVSFDAVSSQQSLDACVSHTRPRGSIVEFGLIWSPVGLTNSMLMKEISLIPTMFYSHGHDHDDCARAADILWRNPALADAVVTHRFPLDDAVEAFRVASDRSSGVIKVHLFAND